MHKSAVDCESYRLCVHFVRSFVKSTIPAFTPASRPLVFFRARPRFLFLCICFYWYEPVFLEFLCFPSHWGLDSVSDGSTRFPRGLYIGRGLVPSKCQLKARRREPVYTSFVLLGGTPTSLNKKVVSMLQDP